MASTGFTKQSWLSFFNGQEPNEQKTLAKELGLQKIPQKKNKTKDPNKPFNPNLCHARMFDNDPDSDQKNPSKYIHVNQVAYQCCSPIVEDGLCKRCLTCNKRKCTEKGITPYGKFNDQQDPDYFTRTTSKGTHVILIKGKNVPEEYKTENIPKRNTKKNTTNDDDTSIDDIDWKHKINNDEIKKIKVKTLKTFALKNSITFNTEKIKKSDYIREIEIFLRNKYDINQNTNPSQDDTPPLETPQDDTPQVETPQDEESTQDINETLSEQPDNQDNDDLFPENEDDDDDDDIPTIEIQGVMYHISNGSAIDRTTGEKLGPIDWDVDEWPPRIKKIHAKNLEMLQKNM